MQPPPSSERDPCLDPETLAAYVDGLLAHDAIERADRHIDHCRACREELSALAATTSFPIGSASPPLPDLDAMPVVEGKLGRYVVERELGRGNMGVVVRAFDPELARAVAIKILAPRWAHGTDARERLRREAQAMARLSHPNVVQVYDVTPGDLLAIAMELVDGTTLRDEIVAGRPWRELLAICVRAGHGLAAAHGAKLIHRDFKPENVLCARDGRVLVSDFGLARVDDAPAIAAGASMTTTTLAGTPAYLAPELLRGEPATVASDQFSFCVSTYEAIYGERPFAGAKLDELREQMACGSVREPPAGSQVPAAIRAALVRGLDPDPARRFPSMTALLDALAAPPPRRRRAFVIAGAVVAAAIGAWLVLRAGGPACEIADDALGLDRAAVARGLGTSAHGPHVLASLADYERVWLAARREACAATHERHELSEAVLDARNACLDRGKREVHELAALLVADPSLASRGVEAVARLRDPKSCTPDVTRTPKDPKLDRARALLAAGRTDAAIELANAILETATGAARAEALYIRGTGEHQLERYDSSEATLTEAVTVAEQARADSLVAAIWVELVHVSGAAKHRFEAAQANMRAAEAAFARADPGPALRARYAYFVGAMLLARGSFDEARVQLERALAANPTAMPSDRASIRSALCDVHRELRNFDVASEHCTIATELLVETFGREHPRVALALNIWGTLELAMRRHAAAREKWARAISILERSGQHDDRTLALAISNTAVSWADEGDVAAARPLYERARDLFAKYHPDHAQRTIPLQGLATLAVRVGDARAAIAAYEEALAVIERVYGKQDDRRTTVLYNLAIAYQRLGDAAKALALTEEVIAQAQHPGRERWVIVAYALDMQASLAEESKDWARAIALRERALAALDRERQDDPNMRAWLHLEIGRVLRSDKQIARSLPFLEHAAAYFGKTDRADLQTAGVAQFWLAKTLWETNRDRPRARALARAAAADLAAAKSGMNLETHRKQVADWLATRR